MDMKPPPLVSVILPVYNGESFLAEAIQSVLNQTHRAIQLIVVDDGSTDRSGDIARAFTEVEYHRKENGGVARARNLGMTLARGEFIAFLDADDRWLPEKLSAQIAWLEAHRENGVVFAHQRFFVTDGTEPPEWLKESELAADHVAYVPGTILIRREVYECVGDFVTHLHHEDDTEWFIRAKDMGYGMSVMPTTVLLRRIHGSNLSMQSKPNSRLLFQFVKDSIQRQRNKAPSSS